MPSRDPGQAGIVEVAPAATQREERDESNAVLRADIQHSHVVAPGHTQIYPALASLDRKGLVRYHVVEQQASRPDKKVYELTGEGRTALRHWVESPTPLVFLYDEFFLKAYSLWLGDPERMIERFHEQAQLHQEKLELYEQVLQSKQLAKSFEPEQADFFEERDVLFQYIIGYEHNYLAWCQSMLQYLEQRKHQHGQGEGQV